MGIVLLVLGYTFAEVPGAVRDSAEEYCNDRGASFTTPSDGGSDSMACQYPNGTQEPVYVDNLSGGPA